MDKLCKYSTLHTRRMLLDLVFFAPSTMSAWTLLVNTRAKRTTRECRMHNKKEKPKKWWDFFRSPGAGCWTNVIVDNQRENSNYYWCEQKKSIKSLEMVAHGINQRRHIMNANGNGAVSLQKYADAEPPVSRMHVNECARADVHSTITFNFFLRELE